MLRRARGPRVLIHGDEWRRATGPRLDRDQRYVGWGVQQRVCGILLGRDDQDSVDRLPAETLDRVQHGRAVKRRETCHDDEVAGFVGRSLNPEQRRGRPVQCRIEAHDPKGVGPTGRECPCRGIREVTQLLHRGEHPAPRVGADVRAPIDHARDRLV